MGNLRRNALCLLVLGASFPVTEAVWAQVGYPGGYPGRYPGSGTSTPFPWPRRRGGSSTGTENQKTTAESGKIRSIESARITIDGSGGRIIEFRTSGSTRYWKDGKEVKAGTLQVGDYVTIEAVEDRAGNLTARTVTFSPEPSAPEPSGRGPADAQTPDVARSRTASGRAADPDDGGPPVLRRGAPARTSTPENDTAAGPAPRDSVTGDDSGVPPLLRNASSERGQAADPVLEKAREAAFTFTQGLPDYMCREFMARYQSETRPADWRSLDVVSADVIYESGRESYRNLAIGNRPVNKKIEEIGGSWSTGEFATTLLDLFSPSTGAQFHFRRLGKMAGKEARVYDFDVRQPNSHWRITVAAQSLNPAYEGTMWVDAGTARVLRIEIQARDLPQAFPTDAVESAVDYDTVRIGTHDALLPVHAENLSCQRGSALCSRNVIDFRNYHKYEAESEVKFEAVK